MPELVRDFLDPGEFFRQVKSICGIDFFCGVPDSLLKGKQNAWLFLNIITFLLLKIFVLMSLKMFHQVNT